MSKFLQEKYRKLESYTPGEQPKNQVYTKLNTNESPYPPGPKVLAAVGSEEVKNLNLYSDPESAKLKDSIAVLYGLRRENIFVANGSDDILNFAFMAFGGSDTPVMFPEITYGFYPVFAELHNVPYIKVPLQADLSINPKDYICQNNMIVIANPNAPTGMVLTPFAIEEIVRTNPDSVVVIDEAYVDFGAESCVDLIHRYENLLVVQTFSKSRSLAGARLGFAMAQPSLIADLERIKYATNPYNVNRLTAAAGIAALEENDYYINNCRIIAAAREYTKMKLEALGFTVLPSKANFLFVKCDQIDGEELYQKLRDKDILVRHFTDEKIKQYNRVTIGTKAQMDLLLETIKEILG